MYILVPSTTIEATDDCMSSDSLHWKTTKTWKQIKNRFSGNPLLHLHGLRHSAVTFIVVHICKSPVF